MKRAIHLNNNDICNMVNETLNELHRATIASYIKKQIEKGEIDKAKDALGRYAKQWDDEFGDFKDINNFTLPTIKGSDDAPRLTIDGETADKFEFDGANGEKRNGFSATTTSYDPLTNKLTTQKVTHGPEGMGFNKEVTDYQGDDKGYIAAKKEFNANPDTDYYDGHWHLDDMEDDIINEVRKNLKVKGLLK